MDAFVGLVPDGSHRYPVDTGRRVLRGMIDSCEDFKFCEGWSLCFSSLAFSALLLQQKGIRGVSRLGLAKHSSGREPELFYLGPFVGGIVMALPPLLLQ